MRAKFLVFLCICFTSSNFLRAQNVTDTTEEAPTTLEVAEVQLQPSDYRLPASLKPLHYLVRLQPFVNGNFSVHGFVKITFDVIKSTNKITVHMRDIITLNDTVKVYPVDASIGQKIKVASQKYDRTRQFYEAVLLQELTAGQQYVIQMNFIGHLNDKLDGFYRSSYLDEESTRRWLAATQFQPTDARMAFPCFDEPALKAEFTIELLREANMSSISNMPRIETLVVTDQPGWFIDKFQRSVRMSTYLVAFMVSDFSHIQTPVHSETSISVWARRGAIHQGSYALEAGKKTLLFFEKYFNITFPLPKTDMVALPDFSAGAMENWGLVNYRETALVYDDVKSTVHNKYTVGNIIAHELAHQWFGNLVTPFWWTDLWLNEGFATWMAAVAHDAVEPSFKVMEQFSLTIRSALIADSLENSHPISIPVGHPEEISEIFDAISYSKGASLLRMISLFLTEDTFRKGVSNYLNNYAYSDAEQDDLWHYLTSAAIVDNKLPANVTVKKIMDTWTLQMGYPVVHVTLYENGTATLTQERFLKFKPENLTDLHDYKWWIPITFTSQSDLDFSDTNPMEWMTPTDATKSLKGLPSKDQWVVFNNLQAGFYRVNYEPDNWNRITAQLLTNHSVFPQITRAQLIGDAFSLASAGLLSYEIPLSMMPYLKYETEVVPMKIAIWDSGFLRGMLKYTRYEDLIKDFTSALVTPHYDKIGFLDAANEPYLTQSMRSLLVPTACGLDYQPCLDSASNLYQSWMKDPTNDSIISPNLRGLVYCTGIKLGGRKEWDFAWQQYHVLDLETQKHSLLSALGCTLNDTLRIEFLDLMFETDGPVRKQDLSRSFGSICRERSGHVTAWNYLRQHWDKIYKSIGGKIRAIGLIRRATGHIKTNEELQEMDDFISSTAELRGTGIRSLQQMRENILGNIKWLEDNLELVGDWLLRDSLTKTV